MSIPLIELTDDFSTWRDNFNLTVDKVNELDANNSAIPTVSTEPTANTLVQRTLTGAVEATSFVEGSSLALKENVRPLDEGLSLINQFNPVLFDWKKEFLSNEKDVPGLIAEEVHKILPQITTYDDPQSVFGIKYTKIIAILIKAVQELSSEVRTLKSSKQTVVEKQPEIQDGDLSLNKLFEK